MLELIILSIITLFLGGFTALFFLTRSLLRNDFDEQKSDRPKYDQVVVHYYMRLSAKIVYPLSLALIVFGLFRFISETFARGMLPFSKEAIYLSFASHALIYLAVGVVSLLVSIATIKRTNVSFGYKTR